LSKNEVDCLFYFQRRGDMDEEKRGKFASEEKIDE
jgi:hypothetical protein